MKYLVIGSEGNIGVSLVRYLRERGHEVLESDIRSGWRPNYLVADINNPVDLLPAFEWKPDTVYILSAMVSRKTCEQAAGLAIATNLAGVNNVLQLCKRTGAMAVFFSTSEVYGPHCDPMDEMDPHPQPNNRYGLSKLLGEQLVEYEARTNGLRAVTLRPFMIYDENESWGAHRSAMIRFATNLASGRPIAVHRDSARGWLHVSDAVRAIEAASRVPDYTVINIGHPNVILVQDLAERIRKELNAPRSLIQYKDLPPLMTLVKNPSLVRQQRILGVAADVSLDEGIKRVCNHVKERLARGDALPPEPQDDEGA